MKRNSVRQTFGPLTTPLRARIDYYNGVNIDPSSLPTDVEDFKKSLMCIINNHYLYIFNDYAQHRFKYGQKNNVKVSG